MKYYIFVSSFVLSLSSIAQNTLIPNDSTANARAILFIPTVFYNKFSINVNPVIRVKSGDTIVTETIDAMGFDKSGIKRQKGGNPLTGPFYIENAIPGNVLAITLIKVSLNRPYAYTTQNFISRSLPKGSLEKNKKNKLVKWKLDLQNGFASLDSNYEHLQNFKVPLNPFPGCIGVAPSNSKNEILSFFPGPFGGNLDFSSLTTSATLYLPVFHEGAYLYIGDGHAQQGDGEIAGNALETSMDIKFSVRVIKKEIPTLSSPRAEDNNYIMSIGIEKNLDNALKAATSDLLSWLQNDYHLSIEEAAQVIHTSVEYKIAEIADPKVEVVAKIKKSVLQNLKNSN